MRRRFIGQGRYNKANYITFNSHPNYVEGDVSGDEVLYIRNNSHLVLGKKSSDGTMNVCRLNDQNSNYFHDGNAANISGLNGDVFLKLPRFYYHYRNINGLVCEIGISRGKIGSDWIEYDGNELIGAYKISYDYANLRSVSGNRPYYASYDEFSEILSSMGDGYSLVKWKHHCLIALLFYAYYGEVDSVSVCGSNINGHYTGETSSTGMADTGGGGNHYVKFWGLEDWWGNGYEILWNAHSINGKTIEIIEDDLTNRYLPLPSQSGLRISSLTLGEKLDMIPGDYGSYGFPDDFSCYSGSYNVLVRSYSDFYDDGGIIRCEGRYGSSREYTSRLAYSGIMNEVNSSAEYLAIQ